MTAIASTDITVTVTDRYIHGNKRYAEISIAFGNGTLTYPSGGVPMPAFSSFGMLRNLEDLFLSDAGNANGLIYKYDKTNHKILIYTQNIRTGSTSAADSSSGAKAEDTSAAETAVRAMDTAVDTDYDMGPMREANTSVAPAAATLKGIVRGW